MSEPTLFDNALGHVRHDATKPVDTSRAAAVWVVRA